jgi:hypothetical protein
MRKYLETNNIFHPNLIRTEYNEKMSFFKLLVDLSQVHVFGIK